MKIHRFLKLLLLFAIVLYFAAGPLVAAASRKPGHSPAELVKAPALVMKQLVVARTKVLRALGNEILDLGLGALKRAIEWWLDVPPPGPESAWGPEAPWRVPSAG